MSRSAADATRFTATGPSVSSKNSSSTAAPYRMPSGLKSSSSDTANSKPTLKSTPTSPNGAGAAAGTTGKGLPGETPQEKVQRLRAQARAARLAQSTSPLDRVIEGGRRVANRAHKVMVYSLIAASGICGALTVYSIISLSIYNRRQKLLWLDRELEKLQNARQAYVNGTATDEQLEILRNEKIGEIEKRIREEAKEKQWWNRAKRYLLSGLKQEEKAAVGAGADGLGSTSSSAPDRIGVIDALNAKKIEDAFAKSSPSSSPSSTSVTTASSSPGSLDRLAENAESAAKQTARSWSSWVWGR